MQCRHISTMQRRHIEALICRHIAAMQCDGRRQVIKQIQCTQHKKVELLPLSNTVTSDKKGKDVSIGLYHINVSKNPNVLN